MKTLKFFLLALIFISCSSFSEGQFDGTPEPFFGAAVEDMSVRSESISNNSVSQGDYIIKTAYASIDVSSSKFNTTISEVESLLKEFEGSISNTYLSTNYQV